MLYYLSFLFLAATGFSIFSCQKTSGTAELPFSDVPAHTPLQPVLQEVSGIADSKINPGMLWAQEDSGNPPQIHLIGRDGTVQKRIYLKGLVNRDWEEMQVSNGKIYIAETGDNNQAYSGYGFYRFNEPAASVDTVFQTEWIPFIYPDGSHDSEAFLADPLSGDVFIITKRDTVSKIYRLPSTAGTSGTTTVEYVLQLPYTGVVGASLSADGREILLKTYETVYYYTRNMNESIAAALNRPGLKLGYQVEPQGEAISFAQNNTGFFTLSEVIGSSPLHLYFYKRK